MKLTDTMHAAMTGLQRAERQMRQAAGQLADSPRSPADAPADPVPALLQLRSAQRQAHLAVRVLRAGDELLGRLLDERA